MNGNQQKRFSRGLWLLFPFVLVALAFPVSFWLAHARGDLPGAVPTQSQGNRRAPVPCQSCPPPSQRRIYVPAIELREAERCEIVLNSRSPEPIDITPTFYTTSGEAVVGEPVRLESAEIRFVPIDKLIPEALRGQRRWGGLALSYIGGVLEVWAQITFHGVGGGSVDETFNILEEPGSDTREAVWWMSKRSTAIIALGNSSDTAITTTAKFSDGDSEEVDIAPFATKFLRRRSRELEERSRSESVKLTTVGPEGSLRVAGFIVANDKSFTSSIRFHDTRRTVQSNLYATNLRLENMIPRMVVKNTSDVEVKARPRFFSAAGEQAGAVELPTVSLRPQEIVDIDLKPLGEAAASRTDWYSVSAQILSSGAPGSLIGAAYSTERVTELTYDVPLRDSGKNRNGSGSYPWRIDDDYSTTVSLTNFGNQPARFQVEIRYPGGPYSIKPRELPAGQTATFDLREMRDELQPDRLRKTLPPSVSGGQFHWSIVATPGEAKIIGRAEVVSRSARVISSYSCPVCCQDSGPYGGFNPNSYGVFVDGFQQTGSEGVFVDCNSNSYPTSIWWTGLWTDNATVATINTSEQLFGVNSGGTYANGTYDEITWWNDGMDCYQQYYNASDNAPVDVTCPTPTGETTAFAAWANSEGLPTVGKWTQTLLPPNMNFSGRTVTEQDPGGGGPDNCWFPGSAFTPQTAVTGGSWTATSSNKWEYDYVGLIPSAVTYYRAQGRAPCSVTVPQRMVINDCSTSNTVAYKSNTLGYVIGDTTVTSIRDGGQAQKTWP